LGIIAYIVPFLFVFFPALLLRDSVEEIIITFVTAVFGCYALSATLGGYIFRALNPIKTVIFLITGIGLLIPIQSHLLAFGLAVNIGCGGVALLLIIWEWYGRRRK
jgi:TRAP-type uncharacterized transport system fused permease subunit